MVDAQLVWLAFFAPLVACILITFFFLRSKSSSSLIAIAGILTSFVCSCLVFTQIFQTTPPAQLQQSLTWIQFDTLTINFGFLMNPLAIMMLLIVTGVGSAIFILSPIAFTTETARQEAWFVKRLQAGCAPEVYRSPSAEGR